MEQSTRVELDGKMLEIINAVEDKNTRDAIRELAVRFKEKSELDEKRFAKLENLTRDINERLREQERYSSKDSVIIKNPPFDARDSTNLFVNIQKFFKEFLKVDVYESELKAYHILPSRSELPDNLMPSVIIRFIKFAQKDLVYKQRKLLRADAKNNFYPKNHLNGKFVYINERLPPIETLIKRLSEEMGYITSSYKCNISVLCCDNIDPTGNKKTFVQVRNIDDIYKLQKPVIRNGFVNNVESRNATSTSAKPFERNFKAANMSSETQVDKIMRLSANKSDMQ